MRKCVWTTTALTVFALSGLYLAVQHAARHPESNLGCFVRGLVAWAPGCGSDTKPVVRGPYVTRVERKPAPAACPVEVIEPIVVEKSPQEYDVRQFPLGWERHPDLGQGGGTARLEGIISPTGGVEESDEPPPFMPLCPEDEPDGVRRMPYADEEHEQSDAVIRNLLMQIQQVFGGFWFSSPHDFDAELPTIIDPAEECEPDMSRCPADRHRDSHYPSCPYTGGRCPVPGYRTVRPMPPATPAPKN